MIRSINRHLAYKTKTYPTYETFDDWPLGQALKRAMTRNNILQPTPIQTILMRAWTATMPVGAQRPDDILFQAPTGTGKSLGYLLTVLSSHSNEHKPLILREKDKGKMYPKHLVVVPSALLGQQVARWAGALLEQPCLTRFTPGSEVKNHPDDDDQAQNVIVGCPESLRLDLARGFLHLDGLQTLVLDEGDHMIKSLKHFAQEKVRKSRQIHPVPALTLAREIIGSTEMNGRRPRILVTSATLNNRTRNDLCREGIIEPAHYRLIRLGTDVKEKDQKDPVISPDIRHFHRVISCEAEDELLNAIRCILQKHPGSNTIGLIFLPNGKSKQGLKRYLEDGLSGLKVGLISDIIAPHSCAKSKLWVGSESDARGLDVPEAGFVVILDPPASPTTYLHMAGRVGRVGQNFRNDNPPSVYTILGKPQELDVFTTRLSLCGIRGSVPF